LLVDDITIIIGQKAKFVHKFTVIVKQHALALVIYSQYRLPKRIQLKLTGDFILIELREAEYLRDLTFSEQRRPLEDHLSGEVDNIS
jgi:hypothetical protein